MPRPTRCPEQMLEQDAIELLSRWKGHPAHVSIEVHLNGQRCEIAIEPASGIPVIKLERINDCSEDILDLLISVAPRALTKPKVITTLWDNQKDHGESTIAIALTSLADAGLTTKPRKGSKDGYAITEKGRNLRAPIAKPE